MNLKLRIKFTDIIKLLFGADVMALDPINSGILQSAKG